MNVILKIAAFYLSLFSLCNAYRLLGVFPMAARSHYFLGNSLMKGLAEAGHDVTFISPFADKELPKHGRFKEIVLDGVLEQFQKLIDEKGINSQSHTTKPWEMMFRINNMMFNLTEGTLADPKVQKLLHSKEKFDAVIVTEFMVSALKALAPHFNAHLITYANNAGMSWFYKYVGIPTLPSFQPEIITGFPPRMSFFQRLANFALKMIMTANEYFVIIPTQAQLAKKYIPNFNLDFYDVLRNVSLVITYSHRSIHHAQPTVPVVINIGGSHISPPKSLPADLQELMDRAKHGVIYFSMGSLFKSEDFPPGAIDAILKAFSKRKETVLLKSGHDTLAGKPENVVLGKWFPQQEILAHPNVKLFVTHGGYLSLTETVYHGVPVIPIPLMADQKSNAVLAVHGGFGKPIDLKDITEESFSEVLEEVLSNSSYREAAKDRSMIMKDNRHTPMEDAVYWVEYVIRHDGAKHLRVAYADMPWYQFYLFDVLGFIFAVVFVVLWIIKKVVGLVLRTLIGGKRPKVKSS